MKKIDLLIAAGLLASASMQAQTTVASLGFESGDQKYATTTALTPGGTYGNWVNKQEADVWNEQYASETHSGEYAFLLENSDEFPFAGATWQRGFVVGNLQLKENTAYRVSFWVKGPADANLKSSLFIGHEYCDMPISSKSGEQYYYCTEKTIKLPALTGQWQKFSYLTYFTSKADQDALSGNGYTGKTIDLEGHPLNGQIEVAEGDPFPEEYGLIINMYNPGQYLLDDILVEEGATYNTVQFGCSATSGENVVKFDFGYPTSIAALAKASESGILEVDPSLVKVTLNGKAATVKTVEGKEDGYLYAFLDLGDEAYLEEDDEVVVSFTPGADSPIVYTSSLRPSADEESELVVLAIANAAADYNEDMDVASLEAGPAKVVSTTPENESFEIEAATLNGFSITYDKEIDPELYGASAVLSWKDNFGTHQTNLTSGMSIADDKKTLNIALTETLADGEYTLNVYDLETKFYASCADVEITFAVGPDNDTSVSKTVYSTDSTFAVTANGTFPVGWLADDNGTIHQYGLTDSGQVWNYNWTGNVGGGGARSMTGYSGDLNGAAIYWRCMNTPNELGTLTFGAQVNDYRLTDGSIDPDMDSDVALYLEPSKYQVTIRMCAWKEEPKYSFTLEDLDGNVYAEFKDIVAKPNVNGQQNISVTGVTRSQAEFVVTTGGYYVLKFSTTQANAELLLGGVDIVTMPSKAAYWKQQLATAAESAKAILDTAEDAAYDGVTKTALAADYTSATTGHFTAPSGIQALIEKLKAGGEKLQTRIQHIDQFVDAVANLDEVPEDLTGKYQEAALYKDAIDVIESYKEVNPSTLSDEELADAAPKLALASQQIGNVKAVVNTLTNGIYYAIQTYDKIGTNDEAALNAAYAVASDDRDVADNLNAANKVRVLQILAQELVGDQIPDEYLTVVNDTVSGIDLSGVIQNPKFYREYSVDNVPGWTLEAGSDSTTLNIGYGGDAPTEAKPVTDQFVNIYGNADYNLSQTLKNLPAGIYTVKFSTRTPEVDKTADFGKVFYYNAQNPGTGEWDKYIYAGEDVTPYRGGSWGYGSNANDTFIVGVEVGEDGTLQIGAREHYVSGLAEKHEDNSPQDFWTGTTMCDDVRIYLVAPLPGYDYAEDFADAIEDIAAETAGKQDGAIYNLAGQRVGAGYKGIVIKNGKKVLVK